MTTPAQDVGCCLASCKEDCSRPPCPCNLEVWTRAERDRIDRERRAKARKAAA